MKKFFVKSDEGFTLVELMVVVAIIGILSAIAVPNFKKYQAKAKQSEAKIQLAALYSAEVGALADYDTYATCLTSISYEPPARGYYIVGFSNDDTTISNLIIGSRGGVCAAGGNAISPASVTGGVYQKASNDTTVATATKLSAFATTTTSTLFTASAVGNIISVKDKFDTWTINQTKAIINTDQGY